MNTFLRHTALYHKKCGLDVKKKWTFLKAMAIQGLGRTTDEFCATMPLTNHA